MGNVEQRRDGQEDERKIPLSLPEDVLERGTKAAERIGVTREEVFRMAIYAMLPAIEAGQSDVGAVDD